MEVGMEMVVVAPPEAMAVAPGEVLLTVVPTPSWPRLLSPQQRTLVSLKRAQV